MASIGGPTLYCKQTTPSYSLGRGLRRQLCSYCLLFPIVEIVILFMLVQWKGLAFAHLRLETECAESL